VAAVCRDVVEILEGVGLGQAAFGLLERLGTAGGGSLEFPSFVRERCGGVESLVGVARSVEG
jgi:hypothetical protein